MFQLFKFPAKRIASDSADASTNIVTPIYHDIQAQSKSPVERLMDQIDYYMHCELDVQYDHDRPEIARRQLREALHHELELARANALPSNFAVLQPANDTAPQPAVN